MELSQWPSLHSHSQALGSEPGSSDGLQPWGSAWLAVSSHPREALNIPEKHFRGLPTPKRIFLTNMASKGKGTQHFTLLVEYREDWDGGQFCTPHLPLPLPPLTQPSLKAPGKPVPLSTISGRVGRPLCLTSLWEKALPVIPKTVSDAVTDQGVRTH